VHFKKFYGIFVTWRRICHAVRSLEHHIYRLK
jgi:hypothetical protein